MKASDYIMAMQKFDKEVLVRFVLDYVKRSNCKRGSIRAAQSQYRIQFNKLNIYSEYEVMDAITGWQKVNGSIMDNAKKAIEFENKVAHAISEEKRKELIAFAIQTLPNNIEDEITFDNELLKIARSWNKMQADPFDSIKLFDVLHNNFAA